VALSQLQRNQEKGPLHRDRAFYALSARTKFFYDYKLVGPAANRVYGVDGSATARSASGGVHDGLVLYCGQKQYEESALS